MAEEKFNSNTRSPRFSTTKALGFKGGSTNAQTGNLQQPTYLQTAGINQAPKPTAKETEGGASPAISQFSASVPKPSIGGTLVGAAGSALAGEGVKAGVNVGTKSVRDFLGMGYGAAPGTIETANAVGDSGGDALGSLIQGNAGNWGVDIGDLGFGAASGTLDAANAVADSGGDALGSLISSNAGNWGVDASASGFDASGVPIVGPLSRLAQGDVKGAAGSAIGGTIGSAFGPIGTAVGSWIGGTLGGGCFITEAVMSAGGQGDTAPELETLRQFRDQVLSATPQGQALIQEYESIAPMVVEAVMQRPDSMQIFQSIDAQFINPAVEAVNQGDFQKALQIYAQMISFVTPFAMEGGEGEMMPAGIGGGAGEMGAVQQMGEHAAMIGHSPEMAGAATGDMGMAGLDEDPNGYDGGPQGPQGQPPMMQQFARPRY